MPTRFSLSPLEDRSVPTTFAAGVFSESVFATGLTKPTALAVAPDDRVFVSEQGGTLEVIAPGANTPTPVLTVTTDSTGERGLVGFALDPHFSANGFVYVYYTVPQSQSVSPPPPPGFLSPQVITVNPAHNRVSRFTLSGDAVVPGSETVLLDLDPLSSATNHNGGSLAFGPDGKLYVGVGENGNSANAQSLSNRLGKVLRINPDGTIPADNPTSFGGISGTTTGANRAIYAVGLRNPFTLSFSPTTGQLLIADVGQSAFEEVNVGKAGANYGWPTTEGAFDPSAFPGLTAPLYAYPHKGTQPFAGTAITGGTFYAPTLGADGQFPAPNLNQYFFADLTAGWIDRLDPTTGQVTNFATDLNGPVVGLAVRPRGDLLYTSFASGTIYDVQAARFTPASGAVIATGAGPGGGAVARLVDAATQQPVLSQDVFPNFTGGVRVAAADVTGDGTPDLIAGAGPGGGPRVKVIDGRTGAVVYDFFPFESTFTGGVYVSAGDLNRDGFADVIVSPGAGGGARVKIFSGKDGTVLTDFLAFADPNFRGGVTTAVGDGNNDGFLDLGVAVASGGGPRALIYDGKSSFPFTAPPTAALDFFVYDPSFTGGVYLASGDVNGDGFSDFITSPGVGGGPVVSVYDATKLATGLPLAQSLLTNIVVGDANARGGVTVAARKLNGTAAATVLVGAGVGSPPTISAYSVANGSPVLLGSGLAFEESFRGGVFVG